MTILRQTPVFYHVCRRERERPAAIHVRAAAACLDVENGLRLVLDL